ncbi:hypothetical protein HanRHA438_Chr06g0276831 [Helianthus annuus]|uniref:Uncharacterized protein n=1 Tax=Helianthus annuus TaxID=4232 RepID=A0A9K3NKM3_HELAN|nr:hypothetical protein HanXRQr2_Chr06g0267601 [Helianthus annuus]KAJ0561138.1 hypothetical protein HanHA300_Chr06g0219471 [Helianthus annuus]KAJ0567691.1 hypothetical protein HanIR_Chr06g0287791 [Helianthus annuus]KAJ0574186.1 hypothetical protein HanHA89_Chr06g0235331 [Helianthus annuus]KAJ0912657.1 hypothetical protein HanRHA438_Chr06g0276831 [Helianthus annuus]
MPRKLIGALGKPDYIAPADDKWRHEDSQSDNEEPELKKRMIEKFGPEDSGSSDSDSDDDDAGDGGDAGAGVVGASGVGALSAGAAGGTSAGNDEEDTESDDNPPEPGYEVYYDERGVKSIRRIRQENDPEYVPSNTEAECLKKKQTTIKRKKKAKKNIGSSSAQQSVPQEPSQEAEMDPNLGFTAAKASEMIPSPPRSTEPAPVVSSTPETPTVTPQAPTRSITSTIRATTSQPIVERRQTIFSQMNQDEKVDFLFSQLQAAAGQINRHSEVINVTRADSIRKQLKINTLNSTVGRQQAEITRQQAEIERLKAENASLKAADEVRERQLQQVGASDNTRGIEMNRMKESSSQLQRLADALKERHDFYETVVRFSKYHDS